MSGAGLASALLVLGLAGAARAGWRRRGAGRVVRRLPAPPGAPMRIPTLAAPPRLAGLLHDAAVERPSPDLVCTGAVAAALGLALLGGFTGGPALGVLLPVVATSASLATLLALRGRGAARYGAHLPLALDLVARSLRGGASLHQAIADAGETVAGPVGDDLRAIAQQCGLGRPLVGAVEAWVHRRPVPGVRLAAAALGLGAETGGAQARAVDGVASTLRDRLALRGEVRALTSQARTSALVIAVAPLVFCAFTVATDADSAAFLLRTPVGLAMLAAGLALDGIAALWMQRLTGRVAA